MKLWVDETVVPDDARGFVSGLAVPDGEEEAIVDDAGYREGASHPRFRMAATDEQPLVVSALPEDEARAHLIEPAIRLAWIAALCFFVAGVAIHAYQLAAAAARLP